MRILLVNPGMLDSGGRYFPLVKEYMYGLTLPYLAALIPPRHEVRIVDDNVEAVDFDTPADAVMLTAMTYRVDRAYWLAEQFRAQGVKTVLGGIHATFLAEEALDHVDAVVVGEAEGVMEELMGDLESGRLKGIYRSEGRPDLAGLPMPRHDLVDPTKYFFRIYPIQTSRGCPYQCHYCLVRKVFGAKHRRRPIADVLAELSRLGPYVVIVDDNFFLNREYALELCRAMEGMGKIWGAQANLSLAMDEELLEASRKAGLLHLFVGLETLDRDVLWTMNKSVNLDLDYAEAIRRFRAKGIYLLASVMFGFDTDTKSCGEEMVAFLEEQKVPFFNPFILTPLPGTDLRKEMEEAGRLLDEPWYKFNSMNVTFRPKSMTPEELEAMYWRSLHRFHSPRSIAKRHLFPPQLFPILFNFTNRRKLKYRLHPLEGFPWNAGPSRLRAQTERIVESEWVRRRIRPGR